MHKVFSDMSEVAHVWAHQSQSEGKAGNVFFEGPTIYSYGRHFPIASFVRLPSGREVVQFTTRGYSVSTSKHVSRARSAVSHLPLLFVNNPCDTPSQNMEYEHGQYDAQLIQIAKTKHAGRIAKLSAIAAKHAANAATIADSWALPVPEWATDTGDIRTLAAGYNEAQEKKRALLESQRKAAEKARQRKAREYRRDWINDTTMRTQGMNGIPTACRIVGDDLETSHGARVPVADVVASGIWQAAQYCKANKAFYDKPEKSIGYYKGVKIDAAGNVSIGCHHFKYAEVARIAGVIGLEGGAK